MSDSPYFQQVEQKLEALLVEKKYQIAYRHCLDLLEKYPTEKILLKLKDKIEQAVDEENSKLIDGKLAEIESFWAEKRYADILLALNSLLKLSPNNVKLNNLFQKVQKLYREQVTNQQNKYYNAAVKKFTDLLAENPDQLVNELYTFEEKSHGDKNLLALAQGFRNKLIEAKIKEKENLIYSDKFNDIFNLIEHLKKIDKHNKQLLDLEIFTKRRAYGTQIDQVRDFVFTGQTYLDTLMKLKKYDKAIQLAQEIIELDKSNELALKIIKKAERKYFKQSRDKSIDLIYGKKKNLKEEHAKNKSNYISV